MTPYHMPWPTRGLSATGCRGTQVWQTLPWFHLSVSRNIPHGPFLLSSSSPARSCSTLFISRESVYTAPSPDAPLPSVLASKSVRPPCHARSAPWKSGRRSLRPHAPSHPLLSVNVSVAFTVLPQHHSSLSPTSMLISSLSLHLSLLQRTSI